METNKDKIVRMIGLAKYDEEVALLKEVEKDDEKKGAFLAVVGDIDRREDRLRDVPLSTGFEAVCGIRGGKLSGG